MVQGLGPLEAQRPGSCWGGEDKSAPMSIFSLPDSALHLTLHSVPAINDDSQPLLQYLIGFDRSEISGE